MILFLLLGGGCQPASVAPAAGSTPAGPVKVLAAETFLADIAQNVAGDRLKVDALLPIGADPHSYEPAPGDVTRAAQSNVLIVNGDGVEAYLEKLLQNAGGKHQVITAAGGLTGRTPREGESVEKGASVPAAEAVDPHFWLDPTKVVKYTENIRDGLSQADPAGASVYAANAEGYIKKLGELDAAVMSQVQQVPPARRLLVTNHEALGYYADRYGFRVVGTVVPSVSTEASPSAQELARLVDQIRATQAPAIFLEAGTNPQLAQQVARETGTKIAHELYLESLTGPAGPAPTYLEMIKYDTRVIVDALK